MTLLSRPVLIYLNLAAILLSLFLVAHFGGTLVIWAVILLLAQMLYLAQSIFLAESKPRALKSLLWAPFYLFWLLLVQFSSLLASRPVWQKTSREDVEL
jgi:heme/copper-type cytochrome/quinol oxidase subunit 1